jgi:hypothetical protein
MKRSTVLLIVLLTGILLFVAGSNLVLKAEFDKIDRKDRFYGYKEEKVRPFKYVKIQGKQVGLTQIQPGSGFRILYKADRKLMDWKIVADTLELTYKRHWDEDPARYDNFSDKPAVYITAPQLSGVTLRQSTAIISEWKSGSLHIDQEGRAVLLSGNTISNLSAALHLGGQLKIDGSNKIISSNVQVRDSSALSSEKDIFQSFQVQVDSLGSIKLPGTLYRKMTK